MAGMELSPYQIVTPVVSALAVYYAWALWWRQKKSTWEAMLWTVFWGGIGAVAAYPESLHFLRIVTGIKSATSAVLVPVIGILAFIVFTVIIRLEELQQRHNQLLRTLALKDLPPQEKSPPSSRV